MRVSATRKIDFKRNQRWNMNKSVMVKSKDKKRACNVSMTLVSAAFCRVGTYFQGCDGKPCDSRGVVCALVGHEIRDSLVKNKSVTRASMQHMSARGQAANWKF
jgi:hypothetical protein